MDGTHYQDPRQLYNISDLVVLGNRIWLNFNFSHNLTNLNSSTRTVVCVRKLVYSCVVRYLMLVIWGSSMSEVEVMRPKLTQWSHYHNVQSGETDHRSLLTSWNIIGMKSSVSSPARRSPKINYQMTKLRPWTWPGFLSQFHGIFFILSGATGRYWSDWGWGCWGL